MAGWVREPAVAGLFYPADPAELRAAVAGHVGRASGPDPGDDPAPQALIAPHAGYRYSGATAGVAYRSVAERRARIERVVLVGPAHRVAVDGVGVSTARAWRTPLGDVPVDVDTCRRLVVDGQAVEADAAHAPEHSLEVHLPFLLEVVGPVAVVPLVVGRGPPHATAAAIDGAWDDDTLVVVSSDLSHYLAEGKARARDERTRRAIIENRPGDIGPYDACGFAAVAGLMLAAGRRDLAPRTLAVATSAAVSGDAGRVVGYGSFGFGPPRPLGPAEGAWLLARARAAIDHEVAAGDLDPLDDGDVPERLRLPGASFVTLEHEGTLVGCIGTLEPIRPLWVDVARNARGAAFDDPRFTPLDPAALAGAAVKVSVLSPLEPLPVGRDDVVAALAPGTDGLLIEVGDHRATFLPSVWDNVPEPRRFVDALLAKAGLPADGWPGDAHAWRYTTVELGR